MSLSTWKRQFYRVEANSEKPQESPVAAVKHSLRKWIGLRKENRDKHGLKKYKHDTSVYEPSSGECFYVNSYTCALCMMFADSTCNGCPLVKVRGGHRCDCLAPGERSSLYKRWINSGDPEPMIAALELALAYQKLIERMKRKGAKS